MGALEVVDTYGENEYAIVRETKLPGDDMKASVRFLVCGYRMDDDDVQRPDVRYPLDDWPTEDEAWAWVCGYARGAQDNQ